MKKAFDPSVVQQVLRHGIDKGYWTLEHLDSAPAAYQLQLRDARKSHFFGADFTTNIPYVNLLRATVPTVEVLTTEPANNDLASAATPNKGQPNLDVLPHRWPPDPQVPDLSDRGDLSGDQDPGTDGPDHGQTPPLGRPWQHLSPSAGTLRQPSLEPGDYLEEPAELDF